MTLEAQEVDQKHTDGARSDLEDLEDLDEVQRERVSFAESRRLPRVEDYERRARETIPKATYERLFGTEGDASWLTTQNNLSGFRKLRLRPSVLVDVRRRSLTTTALGQSISFPVMLAPVGAHKRVHPAGERASVRAAGRAGTIMVAAMSSSLSLEQIAQTAIGPIWFQLYYLRDRSQTEALVRRAEVAGYSSIVVTVDDVSAPIDRRRRNLTVWNTAENEYGNFDFGDSGRDAFRSTWRESGVSWTDIQWLRSITTLPIVLKGIQTEEDAARSVDVGASGIVVSNHGGNGLEDATATIEQLPEVVGAVDGRLEIYVDGGIRKGIDILKALALGARAVFIGRPIYWGLAADGEDGVFDVLEALRSEFDIAMGVCGVLDASAVDRSLVDSNMDYR